MNSFTDRTRKAFTLIELLVVISIISLLIAILLPVLGKARDASRQAVCLSTVRQLNMASMNYAFEQRRLIPISVGPTITAMPWRHILIKYQYISTDKALICPSDRTSNAVDLTNPSRYFLLQSYGINFVMDIDINENTTDDRLHFYGDPATRPFSPYGIDSVRKPSSTIFMGDLEYVVNAMEPVNKWVAHGTGGSNAGYMRFGPHNWWGVNDPWFMFPQHNGTSSTAFYDGHARAVSIEQEIQGRGLGTELCIFDNK